MSIQSQPSMKKNMRMESLVVLTLRGAFCKCIDSFIYAKSECSDQVEFPLFLIFTNAALLLFLIYLGSVLLYSSLICVAVNLSTIGSSDSSSAAFTSKSASVADSDVSETTQTYIHTPQITYSTAHRTRQTTPTKASNKCP